MPKPFNGTINLDIRDSTPDSDAFLPAGAPAGAPTVLVVRYDDTGCASWSPYGGRIEMPTMDRLAANGLTYSQWHTTALCSPTRSVFLTGRNDHQNGFASISETSSGFPGFNSHVRRECASMTRSSPRSSSPRIRRASSLPRARGSAASRCRDRWEAHLRLQLPGHPARAEDRRRRADVGHPHRRDRLHEGARRRAPRAARAGAAVRRRDVVAEDEFREIASRFSLCAKACASDATAATR